MSVSRNVKSHQYELFGKVPTGFQSGRPEVLSECCHENKTRCSDMYPQYWTPSIGGTYHYATGFLIFQCISCCG